MKLTRGTTAQIFLLMFCLGGAAACSSMSEFSGKLWGSGSGEQVVAPAEGSSEALTQDEALGVASRDRRAAAAAAGRAEEGLAPSRPAPSRSAAGTQTIEVLWRVPTDSVEKYHVLYGSDPQKLEQSVVVPVTKLQKIDHPKFGPVYRYELNKIPVDAIVFVSLRAENSAGVSPATSPVRLEPGAKSIMP